MHRNSQAVPGALGLGHPEVGLAPRAVACRARVQRPEVVNDGPPERQLGGAGLVKRHPALLG
eukprot:2791460-Pyramimonas_sp.AAC.1